VLLSRKYSLSEYFSKTKPSDSMSPCAQENEIESKLRICTQNGALKLNLETVDHLKELCYPFYTHMELTEFQYLVID
jgi:hypothetical protein